MKLIRLAWLLTTFLLPAAAHATEADIYCWSSGTTFIQCGTVSNPLVVTGTLTPGGTQNVNIVGPLGSAVSAASVSVVIASDQASIAIKGAISNAGSAVSTTSTNVPSVSYNYGFNGTTWDQLQVDASKFLKVNVSASLPAGSALIGKVGIDQTTPGTTNGVALQPTTFGGLSVFSEIVPNNTTSFVIKASPGQLYGLDGFSIAATTPVWFKTYDAAQGSVTCGSGTPKARYLIPASGGAPGSGLIPSSALGDAYGTAITGCITAGIADNDTTAPAASSYTLNVHYK